MAKSVSQKERTLQDPYSKAWVSIGSIFSIVALALLVYSFTLGGVDCDQWRLLNMIWPIAAGIAAGAFLGEIKIRGNWELPLTASGGFAVFVTAAMLWPIPNHCIVSAVEIGKVRLFNEGYFSGIASKKFLTKLEGKKDWLFDLSPTKDPADFAFALGFTVRQFQTKRDGEVRLSVDFIGFEELDRKVAWYSHHADLRNISDWKSLSLGPDIKQETLLAVLGVRKVDREIPITAIVECFTATELNAWKKSGWLRIVVRDKNTGVTATEDIQVSFRNGQLAYGPSSTASCTPA